MYNWPTQSKCNDYYGNPRGRNDQPNAQWEANNIIRVTPPYPMTYAGTPVRSIRIHKFCSEALLEALNSIKTFVGNDTKLLAESGASIYGGAYNYRLMRGGNQLSMHSWGCAIDLDPERNAFHDSQPNFARYPFVVKAFEDVGAVWGGRWKGRSADGMHFQFATL